MRGDLNCSEVGIVLPRRRQENLGPFLKFVSLKNSRKRRYSRYSLDVQLEDRK